MKITTSYVVQKVSKEIGGTLFGIETEIEPILAGHRSPQTATYKNAFTRHKPRRITFQYSPEQALALAASLSFAAETEQQAQGMLDEAFDDLRAVMLGEQEAPILSEREKMLTAGFFSLGMNIGMLTGVKLDTLRAKAKATRQRQQQAGKRSPYAGYATQILGALDAYLTAPKGTHTQEALIAEINRICGHTNDKSVSKETVRKWLRARRAGLSPFEG